MYSVSIGGIAYMGEIPSLSRGCGTPEFIKSPFGGVAKAEHPNRKAGRDLTALGCCSHQPLEPLESRNFLSPLGFSSILPESM